MKVGFIGLGSLGLPMAKRIQSQGHQLTLYARRPESLEPFADSSVAIATSPSDMDPSIEAVGICVFDCRGVEDVIFGSSGLVHGLTEGAVILVHSTVSPTQIGDIAERAAEHGLRVLDAPVSGGTTSALAGELTLMIGGDTETIADVRPLLTSLSDNVVHLGEIGAGSQAKLINNAVVAAQIALTDDALKAGLTVGLDIDGLIDVLLTSSSICIASRARLQVSSLEDMAETAAYAILAKDVTLMAEMIGEAPGKDLVDVAKRFLRGVEGST